MQSMKSLNVVPDIQGMGRGRARDGPYETQPQGPAAHAAICKSSTGSLWNSPRMLHFSINLPSLKFFLIQSGRGPTLPTRATTGVRFKLPFSCPIRWLTNWCYD